MVLNPETRIQAVTKDGHCLQMAQDTSDFDDCPELWLRCDMTRSELRIPQPT